MRPKTERLMRRIASEYPDHDNWFVVERGQRDGWVFKHYLLLFNPAKDELAYYKASHSEYTLFELGSAVSHPSLDGLKKEEET